MELYSNVVGLFFFCITIGLAMSDNLIVESRLLKDLLANYDKRSMPRRDPNGKVVVDMRVLLGRIESLDEKRQILTSFGWLVMVWQDDILKWNTSDYEGLDTLVLPANEIWLPEIAMQNSVEQGEDLSFESKFRVKVLPNGTVVWAPGMKWQTSCLVKLTFFPFDEQQCNVSFASWVYKVEQLEFVVNSNDDYLPSAMLERYERNAEWSLESARLVKEYIVIDNRISHPAVYMMLSLKRYSSYFVLNILVPSIVITLLSMLVYWLPSESGEKISLAITVLLSYTVMLLIVSDVSPRNGDSIPMLTIYLLVGMVLTALSVVGTIFVLSIYHEPPNRPVPRSIRSIFLRRLPRCFFMDTIDDDCADSKPEKHDEITEEPSEDAAPDKSLAEAEAAQYYRARAERMTLVTQQEELRREWQLYARVLDRCHLIIFVFLVTVATVSFLIGLLGVQRW